MGNWRNNTLVLFMTENENNTSPLCLFSFLMTSFIIHWWTTEENGQFFLLKTGGYYYHKQLETDLNFNVAHIFIGPFFTHHVRIFLCGQRHHIKTPGHHLMISKIPVTACFFSLWSTAVCTALFCFNICLKLASRYPEMLPHYRKRCSHHEAILI